jgi:geranylgeranyl diphosphate synthase type I
MGSLPPAYAAFRERFDPAFAATVDRFLAEQRLRLTDATLRKLLTHLRALLLSGGKRARPYVADLMYRACGGTEPTCILPPLMGLELFHDFGLIHDDIMDRGTVRHGVATIHVEAAKLLRGTQHGDPARAGANLAILIGDVVYAWADDLFASYDGPGAHGARCAYATMAQDVFAGQLLDVASATTPRMSAAMIDEKMRLKTASYTFVRPLEVGAYLAQADDDVRAWAVDYGTALGVGFQIQDDLLDVTASAEQLGKSPLSDLREGQHTVLTNFIAEHGKPKDKAALRTWFGRAIPQKHAAEVRELFVRSGAVAHAQQRAAKSFAKAAKLVAELPLGAARREEFMALTRYVGERSH